MWPYVLSVCVTYSSFPQHYTLNWYYFQWKSNRVIPKWAELNEVEPGDWVPCSAKATLVWKPMLVQYSACPSVMCKVVVPRVQTAPVYRDIKNLVHAKWEKFSSEERYNEMEDINSKQEEVRRLKSAASQDWVFTLTYDPGSTLGSWQLSLSWEGSCHQNPNKPGTWWKCWASFQTSFCRSSPDCEMLTSVCCHP